MKNKTGELEKKFRENLRLYAEMGLTAGKIREDPGLYNDLAVEIYRFVTEVALMSSANRSTMGVSDIPFEEFADDCTMKLLDKLDQIFACDEHFRIPYIVMMVGNQVKDTVRKWASVYQVRKIKQHEDDEEKREMFVKLLDDQDWSLIRDEFDLAAACEDREIALMALEILNEKVRDFQGICFIATGALGWKTAELADALLSEGYRAVAYEVLMTAAYVYGVNFSTFSNLLADALAGDHEFERDAKKLAAQISRCSYAAKTNIRRNLQKRM